MPLGYSTTSVDLIQLQRQAREALSTPGEAAAECYGEMADEALVLLPGRFVVDDRSAVIDSMNGEPWESFDISEERVLE